MDQEIRACRLCENAELVEILDLGMQAPCNAFPKTRTGQPGSRPLKLVRCTGGPDVCGLLQLGHSRSHGGSYSHTGQQPLAARGSSSARNLQRAPINVKCLVSSEDADGDTGYTEPITGLHVEIAVRSLRGDRQVVIASPSALSSLGEPLRFLQAIHDVLDDRSSLRLEERYAPLMLQKNAYDSVCHGRLAYYALKQIKWMTDRAALQIVDIDIDSSGAGCMALTLMRREAACEQCPAVEAALDEEAREGLHTLHPYHAFAERVTAGVSLLRTFLDRARDAGKSVSALGASEEGNVILQCCQATSAEILQVGEIDPEKIGGFTPGSLLPIVAESEVLAARPSFLLVLPWQLQKAFLAQSKFSGCNLLFPLPKLEVVRPASARRSASS